MSNYATSDDIFVALRNAGLPIPEYVVELNLRIRGNELPSST